MPVPPLAHLGHWYVSLPVFMGPLLLLVIALKLQTWREHRRGPDQSGKRSTVTMTHDDHEKTTITVVGPLDYPALLDIETELGKTTHETTAILLDLRRVTAADREAAWSLCDAIGGTHANDHVSAVIMPEPAMHILRTICAEEGFKVIDTTAADPRPDDGPTRSSLLPE
jgi:hypothetical protein